MVKKIDDSHPLLPDHVGLDLWRAALSWRERLEGEMVRRGHTWYGDARGAIAATLDPRGMSQAELARRMKLSKQAVQQLVDGLEEDGIVQREPDPDDGRGKRVVYTKKGLAALKDAVQVKRAIEASYREKLGARGLETLRELLGKITE
jgi:DNA-binding MarR family transcriptional regulator